MSNASLVAPAPDRSLARLISALAVGWFIASEAPDFPSPPPIRCARPVHRVLRLRAYATRQGSGRTSLADGIRWTDEGYLTALTAKRGERVRAEPFGEVEWNVGQLFGDEEA
jgi:hypothetical protein